DRRIAWDLTGPPQHGQATTTAVGHIDQSGRFVLERLARMPVYRRRSATASGGELTANVRRREIVADFPRQERIRVVDRAQTFGVPGLIDEAGRAEILPHQMARMAAWRTDKLARREVVNVVDGRNPIARDNLRICQVRYVHHADESAGTLEQLV